MERFFEKLNAAVKESSIVKITLSKPVGKNDELRNVYVKPVLIKDEKRYSFTYHYEKRDETKNYEAEQMPEQMRILLEERFLNVTLFTVTEDITLLISKKGKSTLMCKPVKEQREQDLSHDHVKSRLINPLHDYWFKLGLTTREGKVLADMQHKYKQICKYVEIVAGLLRPEAYEEPVYVADMGAGKGYLTFALYEYLTEVCKKSVMMEGVEVRHDLVLKINEIIKESKLKDFCFVESTIEAYHPERMDVMIALHACNTATDDAIIKGIKYGAKLIICAPCCHKQIRREMEASGITDAVTRYGIFMEREAVMLTDTIRALILEYFGYKTQVMEFIEMEHTPKNVLLVGRKNDNPVDKEGIMKQIEELKNRYGIGKHYLEKIFE